MAKVYRYEIEDFGEYVGPYNTSLFNETLDSLSAAHNDTNVHPSAGSDFDNFTEKYLCACETIESLKTWFNGFNEDLKKIGFKLVEYEVQSHIIGKSNRQCAFDRNLILKRIVIE